MSLRSIFHKVPLYSSKMHLSSLMKNPKRFCTLYKRQQHCSQILNLYRTLSTCSVRLCFDGDGPPNYLKIPNYLKDIVNELPRANDEILKLFEDLDEQEIDMENEIIDFFISRALLYDEVEGSFSTQCPSCNKNNKSHELFIDKSSGFSVCPWCSWERSWQDLVNYYDEKEDCLTQDQLDTFLSSLAPISHSHSNILDHFPFKGVNLNGLILSGAGISIDQSVLALPLLGEENKPIGFVSISLVNSKAVRRFIEGKSGPFTNFLLHNSKKEKQKNTLLVVSNILDAIILSKFNIDAIVINSEWDLSAPAWLFKDTKQVVFALDNNCVPDSILSCMKAYSIKCLAMRVPKSFAHLSEDEIRRNIEEAIPITAKDILSFDALQAEVYDRIINKDKIYGVKWKRFSELNTLLLGHRPGELSVFTGLTGTGKTTFMAEYSLDLCMQGVCTLWGSFEISLPRLCEVMLQQFSGAPLPADLFQFRSLCSKFSELPLYFLNFHGQKPLTEVIQVMTESVLTKGVKHIIIDNLQFMMGVQGGSLDWWLEQDRGVAMFRQFATHFGCHVTLIVHPRKLHAGEKLSLHSIGGAARVSQEADNVMILQSMENRDGTPNILGPKTLQIVKNRYGGTLGEIKLRFHRESLTLSSIHKSKEPKVSNEENIPSDVRGLPMFNLK